jgi:hypothetical protein
MPTIIAEKGMTSLVWRRSLKTVTAIRTANMISPFVRIEPFMAVDCLRPKKYDTSPETSARAIASMKIKFLLPNFEMGAESFLIGVKKTPLMRYTIATKVNGFSSILDGEKEKSCFGTEWIMPVSAAAMIANK